MDLRRAEVDAERQHAILESGRRVTDHRHVLEVEARLANELLAHLAFHGRERPVLHRCGPLAEPGHEFVRIESGRPTGSIAHCRPPSLATVTLTSAPSVGMTGRVMCQKNNVAKAITTARISSPITTSCRRWLAGSSRCSVLMP